MSRDIPDLRLPDRFGVYLRWPENGTDWIHPEDIELCLKLIPSNRIFQRHFFDATFNQLVYGDLSIRVKPSLWLEVDTDGYLIGDRVEIRSCMGKRRPAIAKIEETLYNHIKRKVEYVLSVNQQRVGGPFYVDDFQPAFKLDEPLNARQRALLDKARVGG